MGDSTMIVGVGWVDLMIPEAHSLKDKRKVVRSVVDRVRGKFAASVAEVGDQDLWGTARIGFSVVSSDSRVVNSLLDRITDLIEESGHCVTGSDFEITHF